MNWKTNVIYKNEKLVRIKITEEYTLKNLYDMISEFECCMVVFLIEEIETRYKLPKFENEEDFIEWIEKNKLSIVSLGINSENFDINKAEYIDLYFKYPNK